MARKMMRMLENALRTGKEDIFYSAGAQFRQVTELNNLQLKEKCTFSYV